MRFTRNIGGVVMGGGGGGFSGYGSINIGAGLATSSAGVQASQREIEINEFLESILKEINGRDVEAIRRHLDEIEKTLGREIEGLEKILFGGSISKNTFIEGASDVDALVILDKAKYKGVSPKKLQDYFCDLLRQRFPRTEISKGNLAVTVKFSDYEVQLLPALRENGKVRIADRGGATWTSPINTAAFTRRLTETNKSNGNKVIPAIKIAKNLLSRLPEKYQLSGYHVEALAVDAFSAYNGRYTLYDMTKHLLDHSVNRVLSPMNDITGQSGTIDSYFGLKNSLDRQMASYYIKDIANRFSNSEAGSIKKELFN